ncbi:unnamed protein product [Musa banksii]
MAFLRKFFTTAEAIDVTGRPINENGILKIRTHALNAPVKLSPYSQPLQLRRVPWREPAAAAAFSSVELLSLRHFPRRTVDAAASSPSANGTTPGISLLLLLLLLLRRRTIPSPPSSPFRRSSPASLTPSSFSLLHPPLSFTRSSQPLAPLPRSLTLLHFITVPAPCFPTPIPTVPSPFSYSGPDSPLSIILLRPRQPPSPSSTPLFALSIHLPLPFPTP